MATLSISILKHQLRENNTYPVNITVGHKGSTAYIQSGKFARTDQVVKKKGKLSALEIKDRYLQSEVLNIISFYDREIELISGIENYTARQIADYLKHRKEAEKRKGGQEMINFIPYCREVVKKLKEKGRIKTAADYNSLVNSLEDYNGNSILYTQSINRRFLNDFSDFLTSERTISRIDQFGKTRTRKVGGMGGNSLYGRMKDFRTLFYAIKNDFNREDEGYIPIPQNPFRGYKISQPEPEPRGLEMKDIIKLFKLYGSTKMLQRERLGLDLFFMSFFLLGMNAVDFYNLEKKEYKTDRFSYNRTKTETRRKDGAYISVKVEEQAKILFPEHLDNAKSMYLFSFKRNYSNHDSFTRAINAGLRSLCEKNELSVVTMYVARHSWATIARNECGVSKDDITLALNHRSPDKESRVTDIYLKKDWSLIDRANQKVIVFFLEQLELSRTASDLSLK